MQDDVSHGVSPQSARWEAFVATLVNPVDPTPKWTPETPHVRSQAFFLPQPGMKSGKVSHDDCKRMDDPPIIADMRRGDMADARSDARRFVYFTESVRGYSEFREQLEYQDGALKTEGKGRRVYQCLGRQSDADRLRKEFDDRLRNTVFAACHSSAFLRQSKGVSL